MIEKDTYIQQVLHTPIYSRADINKFLRCNFYPGYVDDVIKYSFQNLIDFHWFTCKEKHVNFNEFIERDDSGEIYAIYPLLDCGEKLVWVSILHKFGNLCFAHDRLAVFSVLYLLQYNSVEEVAEEYDICAEKLRKVSKEYNLCL
jgi:uncharacterized protein (DUF433 family)